MRVVVTGCNGFLGRYLCKRLLECNHDVVGIDIAPESAVVKEYISADISLVNFCDLVVGRMGHCDAIAHFASCLDYNDRNTKLSTVNVMGTQNILTLLQQLSVRNVIYASSSNILGIPKMLPITEEHPIAPMTVYHTTKYAGELMLNIASSFGVNVINLRIPAPIGVGMNPQKILPVFINNCLESKNILLSGIGSRKQNYISVDDIATITEKCLQVQHSGTFFLSGHLVSNLELARLCISLTGSDSKISFSGIPDLADNQVWDISDMQLRRVLDLLPPEPIETTIKQMIYSFKEIQQ